MIQTNYINNFIKANMHNNLIRIVNIKKINLHCNTVVMQNNCQQSIASALNNLSAGNKSYTPPKFACIENDSSLLLSHLILFYAHSIFQSYNTRLTDLSSKTILDNTEQEEFSNLETLVNFNTDIQADEDIHIETKKSLPILTQLKCDTKYGIQNYAIYASASAISELVQSNDEQKLKIALDFESNLCGFVVSQNYASGDLLDDKPAIYINQAGVFPIGKRIGSDLIAHSIEEEPKKSLVLLTRTFNRSAKKCYERAGFVEMKLNERAAVCSKLGYDSNRYTAFQHGSQIV